MQVLSKLPCKVTIRRTFSLMVITMLIYLHCLLWLKVKLLFPFPVYLASILQQLNNFVVYINGQQITAVSETAFYKGRR
jgi:hypothetical protein